MALEDLRHEMNVEEHGDERTDRQSPPRESLLSTIASVEALVVKSKESLAIAEAELQAAEQVELHERVECRNVMRALQEKNNRLLKAQRAEKEAEQQATTERAAQKKQQQLDIKRLERQARVYAMQIKQLQKEERTKPKTPAVTSKTKKELVEQQNLVKEMEELEKRRQALINCMTELKAAGVSLVESRNVLLSTTRLNPFQARRVADQVEMKDQRDTLLQAVEQDEAKIRQIREAEQRALSSVQTTENARNSAFQEFETQRKDLEDKLETLEKYSSATREKYWEGHLDAEMRLHVREGVAEALRALSIEWTTKLSVFEASIADLRNNIVRMTQTKPSTSPPTTPASCSTALPASAVRSSSVPLSQAARLSTRKASGARLFAGQATPEAIASPAACGADLTHASAQPMILQSFFGPQTRVSERCVAEMDDDALSTLALRVEQLALLKRRAEEYREYFSTKQKALTDWLDDFGVIEEQSPASALPPWLGEAADMDCCYRKSLELARKAFEECDKQLANDVLKHRNEARRMHLELEEKERLKEEKHVELEEFLKSEQRRQNCSALNPSWMRKQDQRTVRKLYTEERHLNEEHWKLIAELEKIEEKRTSLSARCREYGIANPTVDANRMKESSRQKSVQLEAELQDTLEVLRRLKDGDQASTATAPQDIKEARNTSSNGSQVSTFRDESQKARHDVHVQKARLSEATTIASRKSEEVAECQSALHALETRLEEYQQQLLGKKQSTSPQRKQPAASKYASVVENNDSGMDNITVYLPTLVEVRQRVDAETCLWYSNIAALLRGMHCDIEKYGANRTPRNAAGTSSGTSRVLYLTKDLGRLQIMRAESTASRVPVGFVKSTRLKAVHVSHAVMNALVREASEETPTSVTDSVPLVMELHLVEGDSWRIMVADVSRFHVMLRGLETLIGTEKTKLQAISCSLQL